jgi:hypothetical protein
MALSFPVGQGGSDTDDPALVHGEEHQAALGLVVGHGVVLAVADDQQRIA